MEIFIKDLFDLLALNAKKINYYQKYSFTISSLIILIIGIAFHLAMPVPANNAIAGFIFSIIVNFLMFIIAAFFLCLWLKLKPLSVNFFALYSLSALASVISILVLPIDRLFAWLEPPLLLGLHGILFIYSFIIIISAIAKGANTSKGFALSGVLLASLLIIIVSTVIHLLGVKMGVLLPPEPIAISKL